MYQTRALALILTLMTSLPILANPAKTEKVYLSESGTRFHLKNCPLLKNKKKVSEEEARKQGFSPCKTCIAPPKPKPGKADAVVRCTAITQKGHRCKRNVSDGTLCWQHRETTKSKKAPTNSGRCSATTKKGTQCKRSASGGGNCWQHQ